MTTVVSFKSMIVFPSEKKMRKNSMNSLLKSSLAVSSITALGFSLASPAQAIDLILFTDSFESDLSQWVGKSSEPHHGQIVVDPLNTGNKVLNFTALNVFGDIFSANPVLSTSGEYRLSFDYLGLAKPGSTPNNLGGFIGYSLDNLREKSNIWLAGTSGASGASPILEDNGQWHSYTFAFNTSSPVAVMIEDFSGSGGVAGDAYFDNVKLEAVGVVDKSVPEPTSVFGFLALSIVSIAKKLADWSF